MFIRVHPRFLFNNHRFHQPGEFESRINTDESRAQRSDVSTSFFLLIMEILDPYHGGVLDWGGLVWMELYQGIRGET